MRNHPQTSSGFDPDADPRLDRPIQPADGTRTRFPGDRSQALGSALPAEGAGTSLERANHLRRDPAAVETAGLGRGQLVPDPGLVD